MEEGQAVRLFPVGRYFGQKDIRGDTDRAGEALPDLGTDGGFDRLGQSDGFLGLAFVDGQGADHFIDGEDFFDRKDSLYRFKNAVVDGDVAAMVGNTEDEMRAEGAGLPDGCAGADTVTFGFVAGGDAAGSRGIGGDDGDGASTELRMVLLFDAGEEGIHIDEKLAEGHELYLSEAIRNSVHYELMIW